jgi:hypothetical protein
MAPSAEQDLNNELAKLTSNFTPELFLQKSLKKGTKLGGVIGGKYNGVLVNQYD